MTTVIIAILALALLAALPYINHQKKVHAEALAVHANALAGEQAYHQRTRNALDFYKGEHDRLFRELDELKKKMEFGAKTFAAEPKKTAVTTVADAKKFSGKTPRKKAQRA